MTDWTYQVGERGPELFTPDAKTEPMNLKAGITIRSDDEGITHVYAVVLGKEYEIEGVTAANIHPIGPNTILMADFTSKVRIG